MREKGILFTFLTFLFVGVVMTAIGFHLHAQERQSETTVEVSVLNSINAKYDDVTDDIISLDMSIGIPSIVQRFLPFQYTIDRNVLYTTQQLPLASGRLGLYFDVINTYRVFATDSNTQHTFDGVRIDLNVPQPPAWGGTQSTAKFNLLPHCVQYQLLDDNTFSLSSASSLGCSSTFDLIASIQRIDVNVILLGTTDDYNVLSCDFNGNACPFETYAPDSNYPFFSLQVDDSNCVNCSLSSNEKNLGVYFRPDDTNTMTYSCGSSGCNSSPFTVTLSNGVYFSHGGSPMLISMAVQFKQPISSFYYQDANYSVTKPGFDTYKSNVVVFPQ
ncbi:MAG: hypothetical protein IPJ89_01070 [Candidatus Iainarchaeum archaeon]|uniref:Uncharacterized protein n=1 Tax=Candidatus Iainarchaeum sp. TaxID=3101447 RepID=A0A7T9DK48_9ARCH|nr:MAG: hypothetical protein IPJ89_01070 [Candidatus Diapherotrites archaeon]